MVLVFVYLLNIRPYLHQATTLLIKSCCWWFILVELFHYVFHYIPRILRDCQHDRVRIGWYQAVWRGEEIEGNCQTLRARARTFTNNKKKNTSLAAKGAPAHRLQCRNACKIQNGRQGAPKWPTGSGKMSTLRVLGALSFLNRALLLWETWKQAQLRLC